MTLKNRANKVKNDAEENLRLRRPCQTKISVVGVLGLAPCHDSRKQMNKTLQVRQRDVSLWYHCDFWPSSLAQEPGSHLCLLLVYITKSRSFTSVQMLHTQAITSHIAVTKHAVPSSQTLLSYMGLVLKMRPKHRSAVDPESVVDLETRRTHRKFTT
jgi:hypothetical protein